jgi:hypothetical protein
MQQRQRRATAALDDSPIARLYQQHALSLMAYVRRHVPSREDAEDSKVGSIDAFNASSGAQVWHLPINRDAAAAVA